MFCPYWGNPPYPDALLAALCVNSHIPEAEASQAREEILERKRIGFKYVAQIRQNLLSGAPIMHKISNESA